VTTRARATAAAVCALVLGVLTLLVTLTIEPRYQAKATAQLKPVLAVDDLAAALRTRDFHVHLRLEPETPFLPNPRRPYETVTARTAERLRSTSAAIRSDVEISDNAFDPVFAQFKDPVRKLEVVAVDEDPERAALLANTLIKEYVTARDRWYHRRLSAAARYLRELIESRRASRGLLPGGIPNASEALEAVELTAQLERQTIGAVHPASVPADPVSPRRARDAIVAALIGALLGWFAAPLLPFGRRYRTAAG
jgi:hypothetical protein